MATCRIRENLSVEEVLERLDAMDADPSIVYDSSESEIEDEEVVAVFPENSVGFEDNSGDSPSLSDEECESSSESEVDRREYVREQRQDRSRQLREAIGRARGRRRGQGAVRARGRRGGNRGARIQDGGQQYVWLEENSRKNLKQFTSAVGPTRRGERRQASALEYFELFFDHHVWNLLLTMTNLNAQRKRAAGTDGGAWKDVTLEELKAFFGLNIAMGIVKLPEAKMYWQQKWLTNVPAFGEVMPRNRFFQILRYLHVSDDAAIVPAGQPGYDKLHKIKPLLELLFPNLEKAYNLHKNISIDECMIPWRGRLSFRQFIASKPIRFGIKVWVLADSESKYIYRQQLYIGRNPGERAEAGLATRVVKELCTGLEGFGHHLYTDNFYTSVDLYQYLFENSIYACGTIKGSRKNFPKEILFEGTRGLARGTYQWRMCGPLLAVGWLDNKAVYFLSTIHPPEFPRRANAEARVVRRRGAGEGGESGDVPCPPLLKDYNNYMGGVDQADQMLRYYTCIRKTVKWYGRVLFHEVEVAIHNAFVIECHEREGTNRPRRVALDFRYELAEGLIGNSRTQPKTPNAPRNEELRIQNVGAHMPEMLATRGNCAVCSKKIRLSHKNDFKDVPKDRSPPVPYVPLPSIFCRVCNVFLCIQKDHNCWGDYHSKVEYWR